MKKLLLLFFVIFISITVKAQPSNDEPCAAPTLTVAYGDTCVPSLIYQWVGATTSSTTPLPGCNWNAAVKDVWYRFIPTVNGTYNIATEALGPVVDIILGVYSASSCAGPFTYVSCDDDSGPGAMPFLSLPNLTAGTTYYIRMGAFSAANADASARMCIYFTEPLSTKNVGIGTQNPNAILDVNGNIKIRGGNPAPGKFLGTDDDGLAAWQTLPAPALAPGIVTTSGFCGGIDATQLSSMGSNITYTLPFSETEQPPYTFDEGNNLSAAGSYTVPSTGFYHFEFTMRYIPPGLATQNGLFFTQLMINGTSVLRFYNRIVNGQEIPLTVDGSANLKVQAGDVISLRQSQTSGQTLTVFNGIESRFSGYRIY